jgi:hypothetical protein
MRLHILTPGESLFRKNGLPTPSKLRKANRLVDTASDRLLDPNDPLNSAIEHILAGLSQKKSSQTVRQVFSD